MRHVTRAAFRSLCLALILVMGGGALLTPLRAEEAPVDEEPTEAPAGGIQVLEKQLPVMYDDPAPVDPKKPLNVKRDPNMGWLIINPATRRGYQIFEVGPPARTIIQSFDLDTFEPLRRAEITGLAPLHGGSKPSGFGGAWGGDLVHAVDEEKGRIFLAMADRGTIPEGLGTGDRYRLFAKVLVIDEDAFEDASNSVADFSQALPLPPEEQTLAAHGLAGMSFRNIGDNGKLLMLFASQTVSTSRPVNDHYLAQWDAEGGEDWLVPLEPCQRAGIRKSNDGIYQLGILDAQDAIYLGCQESLGVAMVVRIALDRDGNPAAVPEFDTFPLPRGHVDVLADNAGRRLYLRTDNSGQVWYVFDAAIHAWVGAITVTNASTAPSAGLDPNTGRFYALIPDYATTTTGGTGASESFPVQGGLAFADGRLTPVPEAKFAARDLAYPALFRIVVDPPTRRAFVRRGSRATTSRYIYPSTELNAEAPVEDFYIVLRDDEEVPQQPGLGDLDSRTMDVDEQEGVTDASYNMAASGYGSRVILTGGISAATHRDLERSESRCLPDDRQLSLGSVEDVSLSNLTASARAISLSPDQTTRDDVLQPSGRCWPAAFGSPPGDGSDDSADEADPDAGCETKRNPIDEQYGAMEEPWDKDGDCRDDFTAACAGDERATANPERPARSFRSSADCALSSEEAQAASSGALTPAPGDLDAPVSVAFSTSDARVARLPGEGSISEVRSLARGISIAGVGSIGAVLTEVRVAAGGRPGTAKTTFVRTICGVDLPTLKVAGCIVSDKKGRSSQQESIALALSTAMGKYGEARLREPDKDLAKGTPGGYLAAIQRGSGVAFSDEKISRDGSTAVPGLELIFFRDDPQRGSGRQIYQFAGVKASSAYGISCLYGPAGAFETGTDTDTLETDNDTDTLETDTDTDTGGSDDTGDGGCATPPEPDPSRLSIALVDEAGEPLAGGVFEVHVDSDTDGTLGPDDEVIDDGSCVTDDDGTGDCVFDDLPPGAYVIEQTSAPPGYAKAPEFAHFVDPATDYTITFTNLKSVAGVQISLTDDSAEAKPLAGGVFEVFADDGDEILGDADVLYASCTTDDTGTCELDVKLDLPTAGSNGSVIDIVGDLVDAVCQPLEDATGCVLDVPLGSYVVHQAAAPEGFATADDVGFTFDQPGQMASLAFVNGLAGSDVVVEATPGTPDIPPTPPTEVLVWDEGTGTPRPIVESSPLEPPARSLSDRASDALTQVLSVPLEAFRFLFNNPREVALMAAVWALLFLPCYLGERRRVLDRLRTHIAPSEAA